MRNAGIINRKNALLPFSMLPVMKSYGSKCSFSSCTIKEMLDSLGEQTFQPLGVGQEEKRLSTLFCVPEECN